MPSITISPFWKGSSPFTHLIRVDLPEPEGPQTTTTSPFSTAVVLSARTWKAPYHLLTFLMSIMAMVSGVPSAGWQGGLQPLHQPRGGKADQEEDQRDEEVHLHQPARELAGLAGGAEEVLQRDNVHERSVLEQDHRLGQHDRHHVAEGLGQHDVAHRLPVVHAHRVGRGRLAPRDRLDPGADDLRVVGRFHHDEGDDGGNEGTHRFAGPAGELLDQHRREEVEPEDRHDEGDGADQVHERGGGHRQQAAARKPCQREEGAEKDAAGERDGEELQGNLHPFPQDRQVLPYDREIERPHLSGLPPGR